MGGARTARARWHWLAALHRWRVGVRGVAKRLRTPGGESNVALLLRQRCAAATSLGQAEWRAHACGCYAAQTLYELTVKIIKNCH